MHDNTNTLDSTVANKIMAHLFNYLQLVNPLKATEHLVDQLKTQIMDLERFIQYLQSKYL